MYQNSTIVKIGKEAYEVRYPNVGQQLEIENLKNVLTKGKYREIADTNSRVGQQLLDLVDAVCYFGVLNKEMRERYGLTVAGFEAIGPKEQRALGRAFIKFNNEFLVKVETEINKMLTLEEEDLNEETNGKPNSSGL